MSDELWERVEPLLPVRPASKTDPKPLPDRPVLHGILFVLATGFGWEVLPHRARLRREVLLAELHAADQIDWAGAIANASHARAKRGTDTDPNPVDRRKTGSNHLICDGGGIPLVTILAGGNRHDITQLLPLVEAVPPVRGRVGQPRRNLVADAATTTISTETVYETAASAR